MELAATDRLTPLTLRASANRGEANEPKLPVLASDKTEAEPAIV
jgi:hypothetical protein